MSAGLLVLSPLRIECLAARRGARHSQVLRTGMGPRRARRSAAATAARPARAVAVLGFCGALDGSLQPGELVVADELRGPEGVFECTEARGVAAALERAGLPARRGPVVSVTRLVRGRERARLAAEGAIAVDMESAWLAAAAAGRPFAAVRAVVDTPSRELVRISTLAGGVNAYRALGSAAKALETWAESLPIDKET
jgi:4-hydroxy-3-methylbut-2-en-1-yl diphosphate reductase